jgi:type I restriction enzyme M protein
MKIWWSLESDGRWWLLNPKFKVGDRGLCPLSFLQLIAGYQFPKFIFSPKQFNKSKIILNISGIFELFKLVLHSLNMINLKQLESDLWEAANQLRANSKLTAAEYKDPVLGLIFLRYAYNRYLAAIERIEPRLVTPRGKRKPNKDDFRAVGAIMLPEKAQFRYLAGLPEGEDLAQAINEAMRLIEEDYPDLEGVLPKEYQLFGDDLLKELVRIFNREALDQGNGDVFGRIYEYFLMQFSMMGAGAQEGGEFFTPPSLVQVLVNFMEPEGGVVYDPACGSGGMFVQTGRFIEKHEKKDVNAAITVYGTELKENNARLAKMNLAVHGIEGKILQGNTFYSDPFDLVGKCDYVIANPPFNVSKVDKERDFVKEDVRLPYGIPRTDNGNYLWIQYFLSYLNDHGRAGFVMASSAADAGHSEKDIREMLVESGQVDIIVSIANNFFYTRSLPCHLWFFDKAKASPLQRYRVDDRCPPHVPKGKPNAQRLLRIATVETH